MRSLLILEDGSLFEGIYAGQTEERIGRVVLNTGVVGYQEAITDPANAGKILIFTYPLIGNYGVAKKFDESGRSLLAGLVVKELSRISSNWQAEDSINNLLSIQKTTVICGVDTRSLAVSIREKGELFGMITSRKNDIAEQVEKIRAFRNTECLSYIKNISTKQTIDICGGSRRTRIAIIDIGITNSILAQLKSSGLGVTLLPYNVDYRTILSRNYSGIIISNGPEDDPAVAEVAANVKNLLGKIPLLGISTGHHVIAAAIGASTKRMKIGHHGVNYPVKSNSSQKGIITVQNHSLVVDDDSMKKIKDVNITLRNLNDNTIEELESQKNRFLSVQYYPSGDGFGELSDVFIRFMKMMSKRTGYSGAAKCANEVEYAKA